jgi:hypothetical protein
MHRRFAVGVAFGVAFAACSTASTPPAIDAGPPAPAQVDFPKGMLWGSATAGFQVEKGNATSDWGHWAQLPGKIKNADKPDVGGPDALAHLDDDIAALKATGQTAYRFSIEWNRVYPTRAAFDADQPDAAALAAYASLLQKLKVAGITPMVTLQHFALPDYLSDVSAPTQPQGWERPETTTLFTQYCSRMATRFGAMTDWWVTINEPLNLMLGGYVQGSFPPGLLLSMDRALLVARNEARAHALCFDAIHAADTQDADGDGKAALVSYAAHLRTFHAYEEGNADDQAAADRVRYLWNDWFLNAVIRGDWDDDFNGKLDGPNDKSADPSLKGRADYIGANYYSDTLISASRGVKVPVVNAAVYQDGLATGRPRSDFGWDIYPEGLGIVLDELQPYALPVVITENGVADSKDVMRARFIAEHLYQLGWARARGVDVRGYFHWALIDNFEWASGFCPRFGLVSYDPATGARTPRASAQTYRQIIAANAVKKSDIDALPAYGAPTLCAP